MPISTTANIFFWDDCDRKRSYVKVLLQYFSAANDEINETRLCWSPVR